MADLILEVVSDEPESWVAVPGYEGIYEVSDLGRVRSVDRVVKSVTGQVYLCRGRVLKRSYAGVGYPAVGLHRSGVVKTRYVHALVMEAFVGERPQGLQTRHLNGIKIDCRLSNLAYGTAAENAADRALHGTARTRPFVATHCARNHPFDLENTHIDSKGLRHCRTCRRIKDRESKWRKRRTELGADDPRHGTVNGYLNFGCRCMPCLDAGRAYQRARTA